VKRVKAIALFFGSVWMFSACSTDSLEGMPTDSEPQVKHSKIDTGAIAKPLRDNSFTPRLSPRELLDNFNYCREYAETEFTCKFYIAKAICDYYGINDFKSGETFIDFEEIHGTVESGKWVKLGEATDQEVLEQAQLNANKGIPVIAVNTANQYGHVVLIIKGELTKAHNWKGLMAPNCASFFMVKDMKPFVNKSMGYAYSTPESVYLYAKK
jgi:hypothetical protein